MRTERTSDAVEILSRRAGGDPEIRALIAEARANREVAEMIRAIRAASGLSQEELAERVGTSQSTIARLENSDYAGHTLSMLVRICASLGRDLELRCPRKPATSRSRSRDGNVEQPLR